MDFERSHSREHGGTTEHDVKNSREGAKATKDAKKKGHKGSKERKEQIP